VEPRRLRNLFRFTRRSFLSLFDVDITHRQSIPRHLRSVSRYR
jgi:hypothetical protein